MSKRKGAPPELTLIIELALDAAAERSRKRRSSRTAGLSVTSTTNMLIFRNVPEARFSIYDWQAAMQPLVFGNLRRMADDDPTTPISPAFNSFTNPFTSTPRPAPEPRPAIYPRGSSYHYASYTSNDHRPPTLISPSPSLRSRDSSLSFHTQASNSAHLPLYASKQTPQQMPFDLPSPGSAYDLPLTALRTNSSHTKHPSTSQAQDPTLNTMIQASSPPPIRETILDRAFQLNLIAGSPTTEEPSNLSSIARFEALMHEADIRRQTQRQDAPQASSWELGEDDESSEDSEMGADEDEAEAITRTNSNNAQYASYAGRATPLLPPPPGPASRPGSSRRHTLTRAGSRFARPASMALPHNNNHNNNNNGIYASTLDRRSSTGQADGLRGSIVRDDVLGTGNGHVTGDGDGSDSHDRNASAEAKEMRAAGRRLSFGHFPHSSSGASESDDGGGELDARSSDAASSDDVEWARDGKREKEDRCGTDMGKDMGKGEGEGEARTAEWEKRCGWRGSVGAFGGEGAFL